LPRIINKDIKECPYCRNDEYIIKQSYSGTCDYGMRFDDQEADNGEMWDNASFKNTSKYAWCRKCGRRLFKLD
jgi:ribosomal protein L37E